MSSQGPFLPGTASGWTNPNNAKSDTDTGASATVAVGAVGVETAKLLLSNFGFSVPAGSTILGVTAAIASHANPAHPTPGGSSVLKGYLSTDGGATWSAANSVVINGAQLDIAATLGSGSDTWGLALSSSAVNSAGLMLGFTLTNDPTGIDPVPGGTTYYVDFEKTTVTYTAPATSVPGIALGMTRTPGHAVRI